MCLESIDFKNTLGHLDHFHFVVVLAGGVSRKNELQQLRPRHAREQSASVPVPGANQPDGDRRSVCQCPLGPLLFQERLKQT